MIRERNYARVQAGNHPPVREYRDVADGGAHTILIPHASGDIAMNSSVTQYIKNTLPDASITLVTHPNYVEAGRLNPDYDRVLAYGEPHRGTEFWRLTYEDQVNIAETVTPGMDRLYLCMPTWCPGFNDRFSLLETQQHLCAIPEPMRPNPRLRVPQDVRTRMEAFCCSLGPSLILLAPLARTITLGKSAEDYWREITEKLLEQGCTVLYNSPRPPVSDPRCISVSGYSIVEIVSMALCSDALIATRSGLSDMVGFCDPGFPQRILYPVTDTADQISRLSWFDCCSVEAMGVTGACECQVDFDTEHGIAEEVQRTLKWTEARTGL